ncbi:hypothetical protein ACGFX2_38520 [Streptomyces goshikiensis]|uniref:hypothetical protein n=1 Tax=Streptomyces goshikiensis TaxID=1942 RepID=UPI003718B7F5
MRRWACRRLWGLLFQDPDLHLDGDLTWIESTLAALPEPLGDEVEQWVEAIRGQGRHEGELRSYEDIRIHRGLLRRTLYLEELTHRITADWLDYRHRRWPASTNPHLLVSQRSALDPDHPPPSGRPCFAATYRKG